MEKYLLTSEEEEDKELKTYASTYGSTDDSLHLTDTSPHSPLNNGQAAPAPTPNPQQLKAGNFLAPPPLPNLPALHANLGDLRSDSVFLNNGEGKKLVDFLLAYRPHQQSGTKAMLFKEYRDKFETLLENQGLELEYESLEQSQDGKTCFVKIHAPWDVLVRTAEINRVKMPIKVIDLPRSQSRKDWWDRFCPQPNPFKLDTKMRLNEPEFFTAAFSRERAHQFLIRNKDEFFSQTQRIRMVWDLLLRQTVDLNNAMGIKSHEAVGLKWLLNAGVYQAAFPLHDGDYRRDERFDKINYELYDSKNARPQQWPLRKWLYENWARMKSSFKYQPLNQIRNYYGEKVAIYFAWLGFYTYMLIFPAVVGTLCFIYGLSSHGIDTPRQDICLNTNTSTKAICRLCPSTVCPFNTLKASCSYATLTYIFDNSATVFFAFFMSIWAVVFLELWKRYQAELSWNWDVRDMEFVEENVRPEYQTAVKTRRINPVTQQEEPYMPARNRIQRLIASSATVLFMVIVVLGLLSAVIFYRIVGRGLYYRIKDPLVEQVTAPMLTSITASAINAVCILALGRFYEQLAWWLTNQELPRSEVDFENSYTYKVFIFQFINYYAALFYIAFMKGKIFGPPSDETLVDRCEPVGCLIDVCIQLAIIMIVKQILNNIVEIMWPIMVNWWKRRNNVEETEDNKYNRWEKDFDLSSWPQLGLFDEYLEIIIQYGFVTMFVAAFPLAPLFALLNNVVEIRLDAYKIVTQYRRPVPARAKDIAAWYPILEIITKVAVITNGLVIAFTSDFIDRLVYVLIYSKDGSLTGYIEHVFSEFDTSDWKKSELSHQETTMGLPTNISSCWYRDYRDPPTADNEKNLYQPNRKYWRVLVARLFFVVVFEHVVFFIQGIIQYLIPDLPEHVQVKIQRENYLAKQALYKHEFNQHFVGDDGVQETPIATAKPTSRRPSRTASTEGVRHRTVRKPKMHDVSTSPPNEPQLENATIVDISPYAMRKLPVKESQSLNLIDMRGVGDSGSPRASYSGVPQSFSSHILSPVIESPMQTEEPSTHLTDIELSLVPSLSPSISPASPPVTNVAPPLIPPPNNEHKHYGTRPRYSASDLGLADY